jgi:sulfonate transport system substrate-binding protein
MKLHIAVVPEHYSIPFTVGVTEKIFEKNGVDVDIMEYPRGTGSMVKALADDHIDIAIALTEGLVSDKVQHDTNYSILGTYVESPLDWGYISRFDSEISKPSDLEGKVFGISRYGSGSHIMAYLLAQQQGWSTDDLKFSVKGGLEDLLHGIYDKSTDTFMWEKFMLKHVVVDQKVKYVGNIVTPWPCFCIAVRNEVLESHPEDIKHFLKAIQESCQIFKSDKEKSFELIRKKCHLDQEDAESWFNSVQFSTTNSIRKSDLEKTMQILQSCGVIQKQVPISSLISEKLTKLTN